MEINKEQVAELLFQTLETEIGGVLVYETALRCVVNDDLKEEWEKYLEQTHRRVQIVQGLVEQFGLDPNNEPVCFLPDQIVTHRSSSDAAGPVIYLSGCRPPSLAFARRYVLPDAQFGLHRPTRPASPVLPLHSLSAGFTNERT